MVTVDDVVPDDFELLDEERNAEIELVGKLVAATGDYDGPMPQSAIDEVLGVHPGAPAAPQTTP